MHCLVLKLCSGQNKGTDRQTDGQRDRQADGQVDYYMPTFGGHKHLAALDNLLQHSTKQSLLKRHGSLVAPLKGDMSDLLIGYLSAIY